MSISRVRERGLRIKRLLPVLFYGYSQLLQNVSGFVDTYGALDVESVGKACVTAGVGRMAVALIAKNEDHAWMVLLEAAGCMRACAEACRRNERGERRGRRRLT